MPYDFTYMWSQISKINIQLGHRLMSTEFRLKAVKGEEAGAKGEGIKQRKTNKENRHKQQYCDYQKERGWGK